MNPGLHDLITRKREQLTRARAAILNPESSPQARHDAEVNVAELERDLELLTLDAMTGEIVAVDLARTIKALLACGSGHDLRLCITSLENAEFRLRRHLGTNPH
jgi:hypothetical protein